MMQQTKPILEVSISRNDVLVQREIHHSPIFDNKSGRYTDSNLVSKLRCRLRVIPRQIVAVKKTVEQKLMVPKRIVTISEQIREWPCVNTKLRWDCRHPEERWWRNWNWNSIRWDERGLKRRIY